MMVKMVFGILGLIALVAGVSKLAQQYNLRKHCTAQIKGYVSFIPFEAPSETGRQLANFINALSKKDTQGKSGFTTENAYSEVITYSIDGVEHVTLTGHVSNDTRKYSAGQSVVTVAYDPSDLKRFHVLENKNDLNFGMITVILGPIFVTLAFIIPT